MEMQGDFDGALKIYEENKIVGDAERIKLIKKELYAPIKEGEKHLIMHNVSDLL